MAGHPGAHAAALLRAVLVQEYMFDGAAAQQLELLEQLYREKAGELEALLTIIWNEREYTDLIDRFTQAGVKVFTVSADAPSSRRVSSIMTNPNRTGRLAAEFLGRASRPRGAWC